MSLKSSFTKAAFDRESTVRAVFGGILIGILGLATGEAFLVPAIQMMVMMVGWGIGTKLVIGLRDAWHKNHPPSP